MFEAPKVALDNSSTETNRSFGGLNNLIGKLPIVAVMVGLAWLLHLAFPPVFKELLFLGLVVAPFLRLRWFVAACLFLILAAWLGRGYVIFESFDFVRVMVLMGYIVSSMRVSDMNFQAAEDDSEFQSLRPMTAGWIWIPVALIAAAGVLTFIPLDDWSREKFGLLPNALRAISILWLLVVIWFGASGLLNLASNRKQDATRAKVFNRSAFCKQIGSELAGIEKRRAKLITKRSRKNS